MKTRLLKRLRKEAYEIYGVAEIINDFGRCEYIVGRRKYLKDYRKYVGSYTHFAFLTEAVKSLAIYRRNYIEGYVSRLRREEQESRVALRNKKWKKL